MRIPFSVISTLLIGLNLVILSQARNSDNKRWRSDSQGGGARRSGGAAKRKSSMEGWQRDFPRRRGDQEGPGGHGQGSRRGGRPAKLPGDTSGHDRNPGQPRWEGKRRHNPESGVNGAKPGAGRRSGQSQSESRLPDSGSRGGGGAVQNARRGQSQDEKKHPIHRRRGQSNPIQSRPPSGHTAHSSSSGLSRHNNNNKLDPTQEAPVKQSWCPPCDVRTCPLVNPETCGSGMILKDWCGCCPVCQPESAMPAARPVDTLVQGGDPAASPSVWSTERTPGQSGACAEITCSKHQVCMLNIQGIPMCRCPTMLFCKAGPRNPLCGTDDVTYKSRCFLRVAECVSSRNIPIAHKGKCPEDPQRRRVEREEKLRQKEILREQRQQVKQKKMEKKQRKADKMRRKEERRDKQERRKQKKAGYGAVISK